MWKMKGGFNLYFGSNHHGSGKREVRKGEVAIMVGREGEVRQRLIVRVAYLNHPMFLSLLKEAEEEYGFQHDGVIAIPCGLAEFLYVKGVIDLEAAYFQVHGHHRHHRLIGCFSAWLALRSLMHIS